MNLKLPTLSTLALLSLFALGGCHKHPANDQQTTSVASGQTSSGAIAGGIGFDGQPSSLPSDAPRIDIQAVQQALAQVQQNNPNDWLNAFSQRVNEIYNGADVVSIDAHPDSNNNLLIIGYISRSGQQGYQAGTDDQLFTIDQTGPVANDQTPYRLTYSTYGGQVAYYDGYYQNPYLMYWFLNLHTWGGYYTSPAQIETIRSYRTTYRTTPAYHQQVSATRNYYAQTYHGAPVTVRPGASIGTGVTIKPGAQPVHVEAPSAVAPSRASGPTSTFNRPAAPSAPSAPTPSSIAPPKAAAPTTTFNRPTTSSAPSLANRPGGLFNPSTFGHSSGSGSSLRPSTSSGFHSSFGGFRKH